MVISSLCPVEPELVQSCRHNFHFNKKASVDDPILWGDFSITQGIIRISLCRVIDYVPIKVSVEINVLYATRICLFSS